jgi:hypothetical protein
LEYGSAALAVHQVEGKAAGMLEGKDETSKVGVGSQAFVAHAVAVADALEQDEEAERDAAAAVAAAIDECSELMTDDGHHAVIGRKQVP